MHAVEPWDPDQCPLLSAGHATLANEGSTFQKLPQKWASPLDNSGSSDIYIYPWRKKRGELCMCLQANRRLALAGIPSPLWLHFPIWEWNRNGSNRHMSLQIENKASGDLPNTGLGKTFIVGNHVLSGSAMSSETIWKMRILLFRMRIILVFILHVFIVCSQCPSHRAKH